jgi:hypothetical protein
MKKLHWVTAAVVAAGIGAAGASAMIAAADGSPKQRRAAATAPLLPLTERDQTSTRQMGCTCTMEVGNRILVQAIGNELTVRTRGGRQVCRISDAQFRRISGASGTYACGGVQMSLRRTGRVETYPASDSASGPAALTLRQGRTRRTVNGNWGCAC